MLDNLKTWRAARCSDVSATGVAVRCTQGETDIEVGEIVEIYFELPSGVAVETQARVVRREGPQLALEFLELGPDTRLALKAHCRARVAASAMAAL